MTGSIVTAWVGSCAPSANVARPRWSTDHSTGTGLRSSCQATGRRWRSVAAPACTTRSPFASTDTVSAPSYHCPTTARFAPGWRTRSYSSSPWSPCHTTSTPGQVPVASSRPYDGTVVGVTSGPYAKVTGAPRSPVVQLSADPPSNRIRTVRPPTAKAAPSSVTSATEPPARATYRASGSVSWPTFGAKVIGVAEKADAHKDDIRVENIPHLHTECEEMRIPDASAIGGRYQPGRVGEVVPQLLVPLLGEITRQEHPCIG